MRIRAAIFDVYGTLLRVDPPPADADSRWETLWRKSLNQQVRLPLSRLLVECDQLIRREHELAHARGVRHPEVDWPALVREVVPELDGLGDCARGDFLFDLAQLTHRVSLFAEVPPVLRDLSARRVWLGLASNAQAYTIRELDFALRGAGLPREIFAPALCFWSFEHGFAKPDREVFRLLQERMQRLGIGPGNILMVGDRRDNDIEPARDCGWQTWQLSTPAADARGGGWPELGRWLSRLVS